MNKPLLVRGVPVDGAAIRRHRMLVRNLSGVALAREAQISHQYLSQIERGAVDRVSPEVFGRLRKALQADDMGVLMANPELAASHK